MKQLATTMGVRELGDAELIAGARRGDNDAYGELYRRHVESARAAARALTRSRTDADDVTSEAFARVLRALQGGGGPDISFRPYLVTAVRNVFYDRVRRNREEPTPDMSDEVNVALLDSASSQEDGAFAAAAFATLPERWQLVLWHTEVEGRSVAEVAPLLGLAPNAVAALAYRAREGLRQAYLQAHLSEQREAECRECAVNLGAYVRDGLSARDRRRADTHLDGCDSCKALVVELTDTNNTLRAALIPALIGVSSAAYLSGLGGHGLLFGFTRLPKQQQVYAGGSVAAGVLALAVLAAAILGDAPPRSVSPSTGSESAATAESTPLVPSAVTAKPTIEPTATPVTSAESTQVTEVATPAVSPPVAPPSNGTASAPPPPAVTAPKFVPAPPGAPPTTVAPVVTPTTVTPATVSPTTVSPTTVSPTTVSPTTVSPTTTVPVVASLTATAVQRSVALVDGQLQIELNVANTGTSAAAGIQVDVPAPVGTSFVGYEELTAQGLSFVQLAQRSWECTGNVSCTLPSLPPGRSSVLLLTFAVSPSAAASITFSPTISKPVGASVHAPPLTVPVASVPGLLAAETAHGAVKAIGNTVTTCTDADLACADARSGVGAAVDHLDFAMQYVNTAGGTFNSSSAVLSLSGTVSRAFLVWGGDVDQGGSAPNPAANHTVVFSAPSGTTSVVADGLVGDAQGRYSAYAEVTAQVGGSGTYSVADVQTALGTASFGGWSLVVIEHDAALPERFLMVTAPLHTITAGASVPLSWAVDLVQPMAGARATLVAVGFEGDRSRTGDAVSLSGFNLGNAFRASVTGTRDPGYENSLGTDLLVAQPTGLVGSTLDFSATTTDDRVIVAVVAIALDL